MLICITAPEKKQKKAKLRERQELIKGINFYLLCKTNDGWTLTRFNHPTLNLQMLVNLHRPIFLIDLNAFSPDRELFSTRRKMFYLYFECFVEEWRKLFNLISAWKVSERENKKRRGTLKFINLWGKFCSFR